MTHARETPIKTLEDLFYEDPDWVTNSEIAAQYLTAAKTLMRGKRRQDVKLPAFFLIRHACELMLKECLNITIKIDELQNSTSTMGKQYAKLLGRHNLALLLDALRDAVVVVGVTEMSLASFASAVASIYAVDGGCVTAARYPNPSNGKKRTFGTPSPAQVKRCYAATAHCYFQYLGRPHDDPEAPDFVPWLHGRLEELTYPDAGSGDGGPS